MLCRAVSGVLNEVPPVMGYQRFAALFGELLGMMMAVCPEVVGVNCADAKSGLSF